MKFNVTNNNGSALVSYTVQGKRKRFNPGIPYSDKQAWEALQRRLGYEWDNGTFDTSHKAYKRTEGQSAGELLAATQQESKLIGNTRELWGEYLLTRDNPDSNYYQEISRAIPDNATVDNWEWFLSTSEALAANTYNRRLNALKKCLEWAKSAGYVADNFLASCKSKRNVQSANVQPLNSTEIELIKDWFSKASNADPTQHLLVRFLLKTGVRIGEAVGLTWDKINFDSGFIEISASYSRHASTGIYSLKSTKTGKVRFIKMDESLKKMLHDRVYFQDLSEWVFPNSRFNNPLNPDNWRSRQWKRCLAELGIPYRYPYQCRHTVLSQVATNQGLLAASKLAGHSNSEMVSRHYARFVDDIQLPD